MKKNYPLFLVMMLVALATTDMLGQVSLPLINAPYSQNFDSLLSTGTTNEVTTLPQGWTFLEAGTNANTNYAAGTGSGNAGNTYSFGLTSERALGGLLSGSLTTVLGVSFVNNTGSTITSMEVTYRGEQWRLGATARPDRLDFQYSFDANSLGSGTWTDVNELDFIAPVTSGTVGALVGNDSTNFSVLNFNITGLNLEPGDTFFFRWLDFNATGADDGLALDNFTITPIGLPSDQPSIVLTPLALNFGDVNINTFDTLSYQVTGNNLEAPIDVFTTNATYQLSTDGVNFANAITLSDSGGVVIVKFAPVASGQVVDSVFHSSATTVSRLWLTGNGFDQVASIISVASARQRPAGETVTVAGRITVANQLGNPAYVQDNTGGIPVFDFDLATSVAIGDSVIVTGPIGIFNDQKQISGSGIFFIKPDSSSRILDPKLIAIDDLATHEGLLVTVENVELINKNFVFYPQSTERMTSGGIQADLRIDGDTDIPGLTKPQGTVNITGVAGRFRQNAQLLPRFREDVPGAFEPFTPADSIPRSNTFDVVNWNLEFFGARREDYPEEYGPANEELQLANVKKVMETLDADIIAVQEISNDTLFAALVSQLGRYRYTCSDRYSYSFEGPSDEFPPQKVCFIYDTTTVDVIGARVLFEGLYDSARTIDQGLLPGYPSGDASSFYSSGRLPYLLTVNATINGVTEKILLIDIHAKSGAAAADRNRRLYDATVLKDSLDAHFPNERIIFLGDLNDDLDQSITTGQPSPYAAFVSDTSRFVAISKALSDAGARSTVSFNDVIDHQIISNELVENYIGGSIQVFAPFTLIPDYANTTSDHLAVVSRYVFQADEINFETGSVVMVTESTQTLTVKIIASNTSAEDREVVVLISGNGSYGSDYVTTPPASNDSLIVTLPAFADSVSLEINLLNDVIDELEEPVVFELQPSAGLSPGTQNQYSIVIGDNDVPVVSFQQLLYLEREGSGDHQVKFKLTTPPVTDQKVTLAVLNGPGISYGSDYVTSPAVAQSKVVVLIPAGSAESSFTFTPKSDNRRELPEIVSFYMESASSGLLIEAPRLTLFTILDGNRRLLQFVVSPNPTVGTVKITAEGLEQQERVQAELRNPDGAFLYRGESSVKQLEDIATAKLQGGRRGVYTLKIAFEEETYLLRILKN